MRLLHTMLRVRDLPRAIAFYENVLGMTLQRQKELAEARCTLAFMGYGPESTHSVIELSHDWDEQEYVLGNAYGHIGIEVADAEKACARVREHGFKVTRAPYVNANKTSVIAFIEDPDGYSIEFIQKIAA